MTSILEGAFPDEGLVALGVGDGGIEELSRYVDESKVQWALVEIHVGGATLRRKKVVFLHVNMDGCPTMARSRANEYTAHVKTLLQPEDSGFFPTIEFTSKDEITVERVMERVQTYMLEISAEYSVEWLLHEHELKIAQIKQARRENLRPPPAAAGEDGRRRWRCPGHQSTRIFTTGRDALRAVSEKFGPWNWMFWRPAPEPDCAEVISGGSDSLEEMQAYLAQSLEEPMFGLLRMGFGIGRLRRTKHIFVHATGLKASHVKRGVVAGERSRMKKWVETLVVCSVQIEVTDETTLTAEDIVERVRKAAEIDDDDIGPDRGKKSIFSVEAMREAALEERSKMYVPGEAEALEEDSAAQRKRWMQLPVDELLRLFHYEGAPNWLLFGPGDDWLQKPAPSPIYHMASGKLKPGVRFGAAAMGGGFMSAEARRREAQALQSPVSPAIPPSMSFGASAATGVADSDLQRKLALQRDKQAKAHFAETAGAVGEQAGDGGAPSDGAAAPPTETHGASAAKGVADPRLQVLLAQQRDKQAKARAVEATGAPEETPGDQGDSSGSAAVAPPTETLAGNATKGAADKQGAVARPEAPEEAARPLEQGAPGDAQAPLLPTGSASSSGSQGHRARPPEEQREDADGSPRIPRSDTSQCRQRKFKPPKPPKEEKCQIS